MEQKNKTSSNYESLNRKLRELQKIVERYELAIAGSAAGIWDRNLQTDEVFYSDGLKELLGYASHEFADTQDEFWNRLHPDDYQSARLAIDDLIMEGVPLKMEFRLQAKSGEYKWFLARGQTLRDNTGKPIRVSGSLLDINERKRMQEGGHPDEDVSAPASTTTIRSVTHWCHCPRGRCHPTPATLPPTWC